MCFCLWEALEVADLTMNEIKRVNGRKQKKFTRYKTTTIQDGWFSRGLLRVVWHPLNCSFKMVTLVWWLWSVVNVAGFGITWKWSLDEWLTLGTCLGVIYLIGLLRLEGPPLCRRHHFMDWARERGSWLQTLAALCFLPMNSVWLSALDSCSMISLPG